MPQFINVYTKRWKGWVGGVLNREKDAIYVGVAIRTLVAFAHNRHGVRPSRDDDLVHLCECLGPGKEPNVCVVGGPDCKDNRILKKKWGGENERKKVKNAHSSRMRIRCEPR